MRKLALLTTALFGLAFANASYAQSNEAGPQPGLPPGASVGAPNSLQPRATGRITTTPTDVTSAPVPYVAPRSTYRRHRIYRHRPLRHHTRRHTHHIVRTAPVATDTAPAQ